MKRFAFRLERVRRLRQMVKREAEAALARALAVEGARQREVDAARAAAEREGRDLHEMLISGTNVDGGDIQAAAVRMAALADTERVRRTALAAAHEQVVEHERRCIEATRAAKVMDKLREKKEQLWRIEFEREEQRSLDELFRSRSRHENEETRLP